MATPANTCYVCARASEIREREREMRSVHVSVCIVVATVSHSDESDRPARINLNRGVDLNLGKVASVHDSVVQAPIRVQASTSE